MRPSQIVKQNMYVASGIFMWGTSERQTGRYGAFYLSDSNFFNDVKVVPFMDDLEDFVGKRVRVLCRVTENRKSGHCGDQFLDLKPKKPKVGAIIDLGVAVFALGSMEYDPKIVTIVMKPADGRREQWIDPRKMFRLHDQTVEVFVIETTDDFTPADMIVPATDSGMISNGDGSFQIRKVDPNNIGSIVPKVERLGRGLFGIGTNFGFGEPVEYHRKKYS